jgi:hypothetical protein
MKCSERSLPPHFAQNSLERSFEASFLAQSFLAQSFFSVAKT